MMMTIITHVIVSIRIVKTKQHVGTRHRVRNLRNILIATPNHNNDSIRIINTSTTTTNNNNNSNKHASKHTNSRDNSNTSLLSDLSDTGSCGPAEA